MKFERGDFPRIQISLIVAVAMAAAGATIAWWSHERAVTAGRSLAAASAQKQEFDQKLRQVRQEENEIKAKAATYSNWSARGIIGDEQRLDWVEMIRDIKTTRKLLDIQYEFAPQQSLGQPPGGGFVFQNSTMKLQMKLLHEGDLINFINDLRAHAKAYVRVRSCNLSRIAKSAASAGETALLQAECTLDWTTIQPGGRKP